MVYNISMNKILIVGNVLKDIYLKLDERHEPLETDTDDTKWLSVGFNGSTHQFFNRASLYSGAIVTLEVLKNFGHDATVYGQPDELNDGFITGTLKTANYRYILAAGNQISYLTPSEKHPTVFDAKDIAKSTTWLFLDRSAVLDKTLVENLSSLLTTHPGLKLAFYAPKHLPKFTEPLLKRAKIVFTDQPLPVQSIEGKLCQISERELRLGTHKIAIKKLEKTEFFTHLTVYSVAAASILGALLNNKSEEDTLLMAKLNLENMKLDRTLSQEELTTLAMETKESQVNLRQMAKQLVGNHKGILAADESGGSIHKKFESMHIPDDYDHRRDYRNLFFTTDGLENYVNGVILFDETARQFADDGRDFVKFLTSKGIIPGIKVDKGLANMPSSQEKYTLGLAGLDERLEEYYDMGLRFAKWRAAFEITPTPPPQNTPRSLSSPHRRTRSRLRRRLPRRTLRRHHRHHLKRTLRRARPPRSRPRGHHSQSQHDPRRQTIPNPVHPERSRRLDRQSPPQIRPRNPRRRCLPLWRPNPRASHRQPPSHHRPRPLPLASHLLLRPRAARPRPRSLGWRQRQLPRCPNRLPRATPGQLRRPPKIRLTSPCTY